MAVFNFCSLSVSNIFQLKIITALQTNSLINTDTSNSVIKHGRGVTVYYNTFLSVD